MSVLLTAVNTSDIIPLPDGLLVTGRSRLKVQVAEWTVLVTLDQPKVDTTMLSQYELIKSNINKARTFHTVTRGEANQWIQRLDRKQRTLQNLITATVHGSTDRRVKRGVINLGGSFLQWLFGTATDADIQACRRLIEITRIQQKLLVHVSDKLVTVVNHTRNNVIENREQINAIRHYLSDTLSNRVNRLVQATNMTKYHVHVLWTAFNLERAVSTYESTISEWERALDKFNRQKASLEMGRLTEELLPPVQLRGILDQAVTPMARTVEPLQWYYEYTTVYPVWGGSTLIYRVKLPLVQELDYWRYNIQAWPSPYNKSGYAAQLMLTHKDVGLNPRTGEIFHPVACTGQGPTVCRSGPTYKPGAWSCARAIITGDKRQRHTCEVELSHNKGLTRAIEIAHGEYILITWGERIATRCISSPEKIMTLSPGTYLISVREKCTVSGEQWKLSGMIQRMGRVLIRALMVQEIMPLEMHSLIPEGDALKELEPLKLKQLRPVKRVHLERMKEMPNNDLIDWNYHSHNVSWGLLIVLVPLTIAMILLCVYVVKNRKQFPGIILPRPGRRDLKSARHGERERNEDIEMNTREHPFAYFQNLNLREEERDTQPMEVDPTSNEASPHSRQQLEQ